MVWRQLVRKSLVVGLVGTYPPTKCGIATFTASLGQAMTAARPHWRFEIVASSERPEPRGAEVAGEMLPGLASSRASAALLEDTDVVLIQHEYGIYGGDDGADVLELVKALDVPLVIVLHTVPRTPSSGQRLVLEELVGLAQTAVVQSRAAQAQLLARYAVDSTKVNMIPHGAPANYPGSPPPSGQRGPPVVLTWGLLSPAKGIEWGIEAIARLQHMTSAPRYRVVGETHPRVRAVTGEAYRNQLLARAKALGVANSVEFDNEFHDQAALLREVRNADVVLLPYRSREQVVSGVLVEAIASGKPVVATRFPHAEELLSEGSGLLVPQDDPAATADAIHRLLTDPELAAHAVAVAHQQARQLVWHSVAERYLRLLRRVVARTDQAREHAVPLSAV